MRVPTPKQMALLAEIPVGTAIVNPRRHQWRPLLNHGWVEAVWPKEWENSGLAYDGLRSYLPSLRITPDGLRALADAIDKHGQPDPAEPQSQADARWFGLANPHALADPPRQQEEAAAAAPGSDLPPSTHNERNRNAASR